MDRLGNLYPQTDNMNARKIISRYIDSDGVIVGWGRSADGELGNSTRYNILEPFMIGGHDKPIRIACSGMSSVWLGVRNVVMTMGSGMWGELAVGNPRFYARVIANEANMPICPGQAIVPFFDPKDIVVDVAAGHSYFTSVSIKGVVFAWGANNYGQCHPDLYNACCGFAQTRSIPNARIVEVACANYTVLARTLSGSIYGWGFSQLLGDLRELKSELAAKGQELVARPNSEELEVVPHPVRIRAFEGKGIVHIRGGPWHFAAVDTRGKVYVWGLGNNGRLGHGHENDVLVPTIVAALAHKQVIDVACGSFHTVFVTSDGEAYACGDNQAGQCGVLGKYCVPTPRMMHIRGNRSVLHASCGRLHTILLLSTGELVVYGSGMALGVGYGYGMRLVRCQPVMDNYTSLWTVSGKSHNFAMTIPKNTFMIVLGKPHRGVAPTMWSSGLKEGILSCGIGAGFTLLVSRRGSLYSFGLGGWGQLGIKIANATAFTPANEPVVSAATRVHYFSRTIVTYVAAGLSFSMAIIESDRVYAWGNNSYGQCGLGVDPIKHPRITQPREVAWLADKQILQVACGDYFALALRSSGEVYSWGVIDCCGNGIEPDENVVPPHMIMPIPTKHNRKVVLSPVLVSGLSNIIQIAAQGWHALALNAIGEIFAWGIGDNGCLGLGNSENVYVPRRIEHYGFFTRIGCGVHTSYGIDDDARLFVWGMNDKMQLGLPAPQVLTPTHVLDNVSEAALGQSYTLALTYAGTLHMSGVLEFDGDMTYRSTSFDDKDNLPEAIKPTKMKQERLRGIRLFGGLEHAVVLCEKDPISSEALSCATAALRKQPERIIANFQKSKSVK